MVIIRHYSLECKSDSEFFVKSFEMSHCPHCDGDFKIIGSRKRTLYCKDGSKIVLLIRRLRCNHCGKISHELPDIIVPYKRYEADVIEDILSVNDPLECYPCETSTAIKIKCWFYLLHQYFEGAVRALCMIWNQPAFIKLPIYPVEDQSDGWIKILVRNLVNSGRWPHTRFA